MKHCLTLDLEDWYHSLPPNLWDKCDSMLEEPTYWFLEQLESLNIKCTFFILGYIANRHKRLVEDIKQSGHEIGIHGYNHELVYKQTKEQFRSDIERALEAVELDRSNNAIIYRAPCFSITRGTEWAWDVLADQGIEVDSSVFGGFHFEGGYKQKYNGPYQIKIGDEKSLIEIPIIPGSFYKMRIPYNGGGYFRFLPYNWVKKLLNEEKKPVIFYFHPRDMDERLPPYSNISGFKKWRVTVGLNKARVKLKKLLADNKWGAISEVHGRLIIENRNFHRK